MTQLIHVDKLLLPQYSNLDASDSCWFIREWEKGAPKWGGNTNDIIDNFKKAVSYRTSDPRVWAYKNGAIQTFAQEFKDALNIADPRLLTQMTFVPIPGSEARNGPGFDDRMLRMLQAAGAQDIREILFQAVDRQKAHHGGPRSPAPYLQSWSIDSSLLTPAPKVIGIVDDVITSGAQYKAAKTILASRFPGVPIYGLFISRVKS